MTELTIDQALQQAIESHKAGRVQEADRLYTAILKAQPKHPDANHNMGVLAVGVGKVEQALPFFKTALEANPATAQFWISYIDALIKLDKLVDAQAVLAQAKSKGAKSDGFDKLEQQLQEAGHEPLQGKQIASEPQPKQPNVLNTLKLDQAIKLANRKAKAGSTEEAKRVYRDILTKFPKNKRASNGLKALADGPGGKASKDQDPPQDQLQSLIDVYSQGRLQQALQQSEALIKKFPKSVILLNIQGATLKGLCQLDRSIEAYRKAIAINPDCADTYNNIGNVLKDQGQLEEAIEAYNKGIKLKPDYAEAYSNMGIALQEQGKVEEAIAAYKRAMAIKPDFATTYNNMGFSLQKKGNLDEAIACYNRALTLQPSYADAYNNMGNALQEQGKLEKAIEAYREAIALKPHYAEAYSNMGNTLRRQDKLEKAIEAYNKAITLRPDYAEAWTNGAEALEKWNKLEQLSLWLERAFQVFEPVPSDICFMKSKLLWRNKDTNEAIELMGNIDFEFISTVRKQDFLHLKAKCYEASQNYDLAYENFKKMNSLAIKSPDFLKLDPEGFFKRINHQLTTLNYKNLGKNLKVAEKPNLIPVFLVGFPRSGTTLLDTILRSHSNIDVVEEKPTVNAAKAFIQESGYDEIGRTLPNKVILGARQAYITELAKHRDDIDNKSVIIDKMPLNLLQAPLIQQIYPNAKFILALRHPLDSILSCWMQNFKLNSAMANMVNLDRIVEYYCVAMETFKICRAKDNLSVHEIRYEDLLENFTGETSELLKFLDLDWENQMENFQKTALKRGRINTPSYSQVVQPIYQDSKYKWLHYEKYLRQYFTQVEPWINEFHYSDH